MINHEGEGLSLKTRKGHVCGLDLIGFYNFPRKSLQYKLKTVIVEERNWMRLKWLDQSLCALEVIKFLNAIFFYARHSKIIDRNSHWEALWPRYQF